MKVKTAVSIVEKHGQYYARWRSDELVTDRNGEEKHREHFEPTYVPIPPPESPAHVITKSQQLALEVGQYKAELVSPHRPSSELQQIKLAEFAVRSSGMGTESTREFFPLFLIDYAHTPTKTRKLPLKQAVSSMALTLGKVLKNLHGDRSLHPSTIPASRLQAVIDKIGQDQTTHVENVRCAYKYGLEKGYVHKLLNPAAALTAKTTCRVSRIPHEQADVQRALIYMRTINRGDEWQLFTLSGVYTPMRISTCCKLQLKPTNFVRPEMPRKCAFLDLSKTEWEIEFYDTKGGKWEIQILAPHFMMWLEPYILKHKLGPGDYVFPDFARLRLAPSREWERIMEESGCEMQYATVNGHRRCLTGFHSLRISLDKWVKENKSVELSQEDIENSLLRHSSKVHRKSYNSNVPNAPQQRRINAGRPSFVPGGSDATVALFELRKKKQTLIAELGVITETESELSQIIEKEKNNNDTTPNETGSAAGA